MARLPIYEQQTSAKAGRLTAQEMGAGTGQAMGQMGSVVADIGLNMKRREDTLDRVRLFGEFDTFAQEAFEALAPEDIVNKDTFEKYQAGLKEKAQEVLSAHSGTGDSRAAFQAQLENQTTQYQKMAMGQRVKASLQMVGNMVDKFSNQLAIQGSFAPQEMPNLFSEYDAKLEEIRDAIPAGQYEEWRTAGRSKIVTNTIKSLMTQGNDIAAEMLMKDPNVGTFLDPNTARSFSIEIAVNKGKQEAEVARQDANVRKYTAMLGNLSPTQVMKIRSLPPKKDMTISDEIIEFEIVSGRSATQNEIDRRFNMEAETGTGLGGNSLRAQAVRFVSANAPAYANGMMDPVEARNFEAMYTEAYAAVDKTDPVTGMWTKIQPTVPAFATEAMRRGSGLYGGLSMPTQQPAAGAPMSAQAGSAAPAAAERAVVSVGGQPLNRPPRPGEEIELTVGGRRIGTTTVGPDGMWRTEDVKKASPAASSPQENKTIWEMASDIAGPTPAVKAGVGGIPYVGEVTQGGGQTASNRAYVKTQISEMINALSINPRNPVALVEMIRKEIDIDPKVIDDPSAYRRRIEGVSRSLTERLIEESNAANDTSLPVKTRQDALDVANTIRNFQQKLMPPQVKNLKELEQMKLPPGSKFITHDGRLKRVKGNQ